MKRVLFLTGTRADYGKLKSLIKCLEAEEGFEPYVYVTGMHTLSRYGYTAQEVIKDGYKNIYVNINHHAGDPMEMVLANTIKGMSRYVYELQPDMVVVHGDRVEAFAGAIVGVFTNTLVAHIEGGELSGTVDESIRHSISKLAHIHFVSNKDAYSRLCRMGEDPNSVYEIGSPDYDVMFQGDLPSIEEVKKYYEIPFDEYGIVIFHPVTTEYERFKLYSETFVEAINESGKNFVVIYPNNDDGGEYISNAYEKLNSKKTKIFPSVSFERFITLLKNCTCVLGNSSAGVREAPCYGIPVVDVGSRQDGRFRHDCILNVDYSKKNILDAIHSQWGADYSGCKINKFGDGRASERFFEILKGRKVWETSIQKKVCNDLC